MAWGRGDIERARRHHEAALALRRAQDDPDGVAQSLHNLGNLALERGDYGQARALHEEALAIRRARGSPRDVALSLCNLGRLAALRGEYGTAHILLEESLRLAAQIGGNLSRAWPLHALGELALLEGDAAAAAGAFAESLALAREVGLKEAVGALEGIALAAARGGAEPAVRLLGAAEAVRETIRAPQLPTERVHSAPAVARLRAALGEPAFPPPGPPAGAWGWTRRSRRASPWRRRRESRRRAAGRRPGARRASQSAGARGSGADRAGLLQPGNRRAPGDHGRDGHQPRHPHPEQARPALSDANRRLGVGLPGGGRPGHSGGPFPARRNVNRRRRRMSRFLRWRRGRRRVACAYPFQERRRSDSGSAATATSEAQSGQPGLRVFLLGDFRVVAEGRPVDDGRWRLRKASAVVKLLALAPGHRLPRERLLDVLWPQLPPAAAGNNLRYALHVARRTLAGGAGAGARRFLRTAAEEVLLYPEGKVWTDAAAFRAAASAAQGRGDPVRYAGAAALYAGDLLPDEADADWAAAPREALRALYVSLLHQAAACADAAGDPTGASGRPDPGPDRRPGVRDGAPGLDAPARPGRAARRRAAPVSSPAGGAAAGGGRRACLRARPGQPAPLPGHPGRPRPSGAAPPPGGVRAPDRRPRGGARPARRHNLPAPLTSFVGRAEELRAVPRLLAGARLVTLTGPGGSGKTRLALQVAERLATRSEAFPDGVWVTELGALTEPGLVAQEVARVLQLGERPGEPPLQVLARALAGRRLLLVLDNCEHLLGACAALAETVLRAGPGVRVLATSHRALGVPGEVASPCPLALPRPHRRPTRRRTAGARPAPRAGPGAAGDEPGPAPTWRPWRDTTPCACSSSAPAACGRGSP